MRSRGRAPRDAWNLLEASAQLGPSPVIADRILICGLGLSGAAGA
jgi:hypothetical protein